MTKTEEITVKNEENITWKVQVFSQAFQVPISGGVIVYSLVCNLQNFSVRRVKITFTKIRSNYPYPVTV